MSVTLTQTDINTLINVIRDAEAPESVTNAMVASVLDYLNISQKTNAENLETEKLNRVAAVSTIDQRLDRLLGDNASSAIDNFNEVIAFLEGIKDSETLTATLNKLRESIASTLLLAEDVNNTLETHTGNSEQKFSDMSTDIKNKQAKLKSSTEITVNADSSLSLTDKAKLALLIDEWINEIGTDGGYNEDTGKFTAYDVTDLTASEVMSILGWRGAYLMESGMAHYRERVTPRTVVSAEGTWSLKECWLNDNNLVVISNIRGYNYITPQSIDRAWAYCSALRAIKPVIYCSQMSSCNDAFKGCTALQEVKIELLDRSISFGDSSNLSTESVEYLIDHAANTSPITVTLNESVTITPTIINKAKDKQISIAWQMNE